MNPEIAKNIVEFLDEVPVSGHRKRMLMNQCVDALFQVIQPAPVTPDGEEKEDGKKGSK